MPMAPRPSSRVSEYLPKGRGRLPEMMPGSAIWARLYGEQGEPSTRGEEENHESRIRNHGKMNQESQAGNDDPPEPLGSSGGCVRDSISCGRLRGPRPGP